MAKVVPENCYKILFMDSDILNGYCLEILFSKILGISIIIISSIVKLPQIIKIWKSRSARSVNFLTVLGNLFAVTIKGSYCFVQSFPISSYGELVMIGGQILILAALILHFNRSTHISTIFVVIYFTICYLFASGFVSLNILWYLQVLSMPINTAGRSYTIFKDKGTGQLSGTTCTMQLFITSSRIYTSMLETKDPLLLVSYCITTSSLAGILIQFIYYNKINNKNLKLSEQKSK